MKLISSVFLSINRFSSKNAIYSNAVKCPGNSIKISAREFKEKYSTSIEEYAEESGIMTSLLYERVFDFLVENGVAE